MKRKLNIFLSMLLLLQMICMPLGKEVNAAALTKPMTHTITQNSWSKQKSEGPAYYDYDDGLWYGRLYKTNTTWQTRTNSSSNSRTGYRNSSFDEDNPSKVWSFSYMKNLLTNDYEYQNVQITSMYWTSSNEGPGSYTYQTYVGTYPNGHYETRGPYKYRRSFRVEFNYTQFRFTSTYTGTVTARTMPPELRLSSLDNIKYHNQDKIPIEGFVKDADVGDINTIYYSIVGTSHNNKNLVLTNRTEIVATGNEEYFTGYIQLDQSISPGEYNLKIWAKDDKGAESSIIEVPITIYNLLKDILNNLQKYTSKDFNEDLQFIVINSNASVYQSAINDDLITKIKEELKDKNLLMYFIGNKESKSYINSNLLDN